MAKITERAHEALFEYARAANAAIEQARSERDALQHRLDELQDLELGDLCVTVSKLLEDAARMTPTELAADGPPPF